MSVTLNGSNGITFNDGSSQTAAASPLGLKNRIINGDMRIDQRNAGAAVSGSPSFPVDRFRQSNNGAGVLSGQQVSDAPAGFNNSMKLTVTTIDSSIAAGEYYQFEQFIEGFNTADLNWGTANAQTVTLSFWAKASQTGTYSVQLANDAGSRCYPSFYTINAANTWEFKTITIPGSTSGTWLTTNGCGIGVRFGIVYGSTYNGATANAWMNTTGFANSFITSTNNTMSTLNATVQLTGVQLEVGSTATPFERRLYGQELANCQRYYEKSYNVDVAPATNSSVGIIGPTGVQGATTGSEISATGFFRVTKRATPTMIYYDPVGNVGKCNRVQQGIANNNNSTIADNLIGANIFSAYSASGATASAIMFHYTASAEL